MQLGILSLLFVVCTSAAIVDNVCIAMDGSPTCSTDLSSTDTKFVSISSIQAKANIQVLFCPPAALVTYTVKFLVNGMNHEQHIFEHSITPSTTDCVSIHSNVYSDGTSVWNVMQGVYSVVISVHDATPYALFSTSYSLSVIRPDSLSLTCDGKLTDGATLDSQTLTSTPIILSLASIKATSVRWILDSDTSYASTTTTHQLFGSSSASALVSGKHTLQAFVYTDRYGHPEYSIGLSFEITQTTQQPTTPPRVAPTVPPANESNSSYCGDDVCDPTEDCTSCSLDCGICSPYSCSTTYCALELCQCANTHHPSITDVKSMPQFVTISWDDAQTPTTYESMMRVSRESKARDSFNCRPKMTFFTQTNDNQYQFTKQLFLEGHEVGLHSITHSTGTTTTKTEWEREILKAREYIAKYSGIPESEIVGFRAPDLKYNDWMLEVLQERGFLYDSSIPTDTQYYPYTLDQGAIEQSWRGRTITSPHPGLWEIPLPTLIDSDGQVITIQDPSGSKDEILALLKHNFDLHYNGNRSPFFIPLTASWILQSEDERTELLEDLLQYITSKDNIVFASMKEIVHYYKNPVPMNQLSSADFKCVSSSVTPITSFCNGREINTCYYSTRNFQTCESCPDYYPGNEPTSSTIPQPDMDNQWDGVLTLSNESSWEGGFCVSTFINNPTVKAANDFVITLSTKNCQITTLWGLKILSTSSGKVTLGPDRSILIKPGQTHTTSGFCGKSSSNYSVNGVVKLLK